jgi:hypothetical protein
LGLNGETTLTITGNQFTLPDGKSGRIVASTTRGYTAVAMQLGEAMAATGTQPATVPKIVSLRAKKSGDRLTLTPVPGSTNTCSFTPTAMAPQYAEACTSGYTGHACRTSDARRTNCDTCCAGRVGDPCCAGGSDAACYANATPDDRSPREARKSKYEHEHEHEHELEYEHEQQHR